MKTIGIDIGTTTICAVLADADTGELLDSQTLANDSEYASCRSWEHMQDAAKIIEKCTALVKRYVGENEDIVSIGVTGQMHGIVYVDQTGKAVSPLYTWRDKRGDLPAGENESKDKKSYAENLSEVTGCSMASGFGLTTHYYNVINGFVPENAETFCTIPDYVAMSLAGEREPLVHQSMAASMGLYDLGNACFDAEAVTKAGLNIMMLPKTTKENKIIGQTQDGIPVAAALGDNQASFLGSVNQDGKLLLNVGTGSQISAYSEKRIESGLVEVRPYLGDTWLLAGSPLCGGYAYSLVKRFADEMLALAGAEASVPMYEMLNQAAASVYDEKQKLLVDTRFNGSRQDASLAGSIRNLTADTFHPGHLALGVLEGMCEELHQYYEEFPDGLKDSSVFVGSGNGIRKNPLLQKICCDRFGMDMKIPVYAEEAGYGAALFSLLASGYYKELKEVQSLIRYSHPDVL